MSTPVLQTEFLSDSLNGTYTVTIYYSDGSTQTTYVPKGPLIMPQTSWWYE